MAAALGLWPGLPGHGLRAGIPALGNAGPPAYRELLSTYVDSVAPGETRFDYAAFAAAEGQARLRRELRESFLSVSPPTLGPVIREAWAVNAYNFLVIDLLTEAWLERSGELGSIMDLGPEVFSRPRYSVDGEPYSLDTFEGTFLFGGETPDPRIHFAIVCGAKGCPPLQPDLFRAQHLDADIGNAVVRALQSPRHLRIVGNQVHVSKLFEWYAEHFEAYPGGPLEFLRDHGAVLPADAELVPDIEWDWSLNAP